ncbi:uncharacterized protein LOC144007725 [Festucalex cinctus]
MPDSHTLPNTEQTADDATRPRRQNSPAPTKRSKGSSGRRSPDGSADHIVASHSMTGDPRNHQKSNNAGPAPASIPSGCGRRAPFLLLLLLLLCLSALVVRVQGDINADDSTSDELPTAGAANRVTIVEAAAAANGGAEAEEDDESPVERRQDTFSRPAAKAERVAGAGLSLASNLLHVERPRGPGASTGPKSPSGRLGAKLAARKGNASKRKSKVRRV